MRTNEVPLDEWAKKLDEAERLMVAQALYEAARAVAKVWTVTGLLEGKYGETDCPNVGHAATDLAVTISDDELEGKKMPSKESLLKIVEAYLEGG